ncbi:MULTISPECIES: Tex family protein [unclassified Granulicatella]|uniref:Tex family protein n=1 Tax=unclassified Granulicatella TaxID=2630493 RepID=UPI0010747D72|nr:MULTISPECIES: Tex family protein [unclassified Granulicatella]MBF0779502.1 RNA-binding transcriptional accessory protein [Granulicatella sp. 19428wC4_WM01]TFU96468.1 RNA-binding transcriptional accessory protein [Granulicatella sp. WM01]
MNTVEEFEQQEVDTHAKEALRLTLKQLPQYKEKQVGSVLDLLSSGNTIPFIARYRKEMTGSLDEVQIREISETFAYLENLTKRKEEVIRLIDEQGKLTPDLHKAILEADKMQQVEDLYRPFKQKRRTKATIAKEKGLEPLALWLFEGQEQADVLQEASKYVSEEHQILTETDALQGAHEILAEMIGDVAQYREWIRQYTRKNGQLVVQEKDVQKDEKHVYEMYYDFSEAVEHIKPHRILAINRGENEGVLKVAIQIDEQAIFQYLAKQLHVNSTFSSAMYVSAAYEDSYKRFIAPSIERELRRELTEKADEQAIAVFGDNLKHLLLQPPMKDSIVLGLDPAYRTGCKLAVVDETGRVLDKGVIYPHKPAPEHKRKSAGDLLKQLIEKYQVNIVAIGNGTASRESEQFVAEQLKNLERTVYYVIVNEAGASVYSASDIARQEFPDFQVEERSAVSIARRLQDPLAELVKIDPKSVGVGQYQHDVSQKALTSQLDFVVETVVNQVGVNLNTASATLLQHVSGMNKTIANNIVTYRNEHGMFTNRMELKKVPRLGPKAFEQAIGFLRIINGTNVLDNTAIHPESYAETLQLLQVANITVDELGSEEANQKLSGLTLEKAKALTHLGEQTIQDILEALEKPGRDVRESISSPLLRQDVLSMEDLKVGMELQGTVRNVVDFGAFVDIGVKQDGLVHLSKMSKKFVRLASDIVSVGDIVTVWIEQVDLEKKRIALTMVGPHER